MRIAMTRTMKTIVKTGFPASFDEVAAITGEATENGERNINIPQS
jgi:hypothetical protein